ncbi:MAG: copper chaperone PCu(A)C [Hyphomicrobiaceae bacterium]|nr:copper chaperone PCu(A)C [Hyphomicrobiaceae bacterium]
MTTIWKTAAVLTMVAASLFGRSATAQDYKVGSIEITAPWTRATPPGAKVAGGFMTITNTGSEPDRLIAGSFGPAKRVEIHEMAVEDGVMKMRMLETGIEIKPGETVTLKPGGLHVMFLDLEAAIAQGAKVVGTLTFEKAGQIEIGYEIAPIGAGKPAADHGHHGAGSGSAVQR